MRPTRRAASAARAVMTMAAAGCEDNGHPGPKSRRAGWRARWPRCKSGWKICNSRPTGRRSGGHNTRGAAIGCSTRAHKNSMNSGDTIVAVSSAVGPAPRMIVRLSGPAAFDLLRMLAPAAQAHAGVTHVRLCFAQLSIPSIVYAFIAPRSSTGEDVVELHIPGNPLLAKMLLR